MSFSSNRSMILRLVQTSAKLQIYASTLNKFKFINILTRQTCSLYMKPYHFEQGSDY